MAGSIYNALPHEIKSNVNSTIKFKRKLKEFMHTNSFYKIDEFLFRSKHCITKKITLSNVPYKGHLIPKLIRKTKVYFFAFL
jgi:hypothetical protein